MIKKEIKKHKIMEGIGEKRGKIKKGGRNLDRGGNSGRKKERSKK